MYILHGEALQIKDELPEKTPKQFTSLYPYAFALGLEAEWAGQFESEMKHWSDAKDPETEWYRRDRHHRHGRSHRSFSENLSSSVSESANYSPPSKSGGGFSGGGSSGGGGGGGGGGGW